MVNSTNFYMRDAYLVLFKNFIKIYFFLKVYLKIIFLNLSELNMPYIHYSYFISYSSGKIIVNP